MAEILVALDLRARRLGRTPATSEDDEVLRAQAQDVRESGRRAVMEEGGRKEIAMMAPVVFFVLPVTILFAFYPGVLGLRLTTP